MYIKASEVWYEGKGTHTPNTHVAQTDNPPEVAATLLCQGHHKLKDPTKTQKGNIEGIRLHLFQLADPWKDSWEDF